MPELIEVEAYRELAELALERKIAEVVAPDAWWLKRGLSADVLSDALLGRHFLGARRTGKRLLLDTSDHGPVLGLRFGMTGRLLVDGRAGVEKLEHSSNREVEAWDRLVVRFADGGDLRVRDPRRLGEDELKRLHKAVRKTLANLTRRGGSHTGVLQPARHREGTCPLDGAPLLRRTIGGRTTYSCPVHQL
jgi:formamidopyrimidine-DNA glycosylase